MIDNSISEYLFALRKESPAKTWWDSAPTHPSIYRALRINPGDFGASYATTPFRFARIEGKPLVLAAHPAPRVLDPIDHAWFGIETVVAWEPVSNRADVLGDPAPQLVGALSEDASAIYGDPRAFFQAWAIRRASFAVQRQQGRAKNWQIVPQEQDEVPGALLIGDLDKVRMQPSMMPEHIEVVGIDAKAMNRAIMRAARLPRVSASSHIRRAA